MKCYSHASKPQLERKWKQAIANWPEVNCYSSTCMVKLKKSVESLSNENDYPRQDSTRVSPECRAEHRS